jgi:hypothetical protein
MNNQESAEGGSQPTANTSTVISAAKAFTGNSPERHAIIRHTFRVVANQRKIRIYRWPEKRYKFWRDTKAIEENSGPCGAKKLKK